MTMLARYARPMLVRVLPSNSLNSLASWKDLQASLATWHPLLLYSLTGLPWRAAPATRLASG
jgi:hypothetical protein